MKKCTFYRSIYDTKIKGIRAEKTEGYCETIKDDGGHEITLCFHMNNKKDWWVTEKSTGLKLCNAETRMEAFEEAMKLINLIYQRIHDKTCKKYIDIIGNAYKKVDL